MAFKGDLTNISLFDVFQTLSQNKQSGVLVLSRDGATKKIHISPDGVSIFFTRSFRPLRLGEIFVRRGRITPQDVEILLLEQKKAYRPFGELLIEAGKVTEEEVASVLRYHAEDEIFEVFGWETGNFSFYDGQEAGDTSTPLSDVLMDPASLCLEAARRLDEMERLREGIPTNDEFYVQVEGVVPDPAASPAVLAMFDALAEPNSIDDLRDLVGLSLHDVLMCISQLLEGGLIRPLTVDELVDTAQYARESGAHERAAQLFEKAQNLSPGDREILENCVEAIERLGQPRRLAKFLATLGSICLENGEVDEAIEYLEQTLRSDATHFGAMLALREAFQRQEDAERAAEMSLKIARIHSEKGRLDDAIESCAVGLDQAPDAFPLRFYYAQLLARTDEVDAAREQIYSIVDATERAGKATNSEKAHEVLGSCYRLLLKLDPNDADADQGLRDLDRRRMSSMRRRKLVVRGGIAAALVIVLGGIGLTVGGSSAGSLQEKIERAQETRPNSPVVLELVDELLAEHPDSAEAAWARDLQAQILKIRSATNQHKKAQEDKIRDELTQELEDVRAALSDRSYIEAIPPVQRFVDKLNQPQVGFLRKNMSAYIEHDLISFLDRVAKRFDEDRGQISMAEFQLKQHEGDAEKLLELENRLAHVRQRDWLRLLPELVASLRKVCDSPHVGKALPRFADFRERATGSQAVFENLDPLFFTVRRERLRAEIQDAVRVATTEGKDFLRLCEFERARELYAAAHRKTDQVADEEPREHFLELLNWLAVRNIPAQLRSQIEKIDHVVATLKEVETLRRSKQPGAAYRLMRDLVSDYRLIQFEKKYRMPYLVSSIPAGAEVTVNGQPAGTAPCEITLDIGQKAVLVRLTRPGFQPADASIVPTDPELKGTLQVELEKELSWEKEITGSGIEASPTIANGKVLIATTDASLVAFDLKSGARLWESPTGLLHRVTAKPVVWGDYAYLITVNGHLHQIDLRNGNIVDRVKLGAQVDKDPVVHDGVLYVATRKPSLVALEGTKKRYEIPLAAGPTTRVVYVNGRVYVGTAKGTVLEHDAKSGAPRRRFSVTSGTSFWGGLAVHRDLVLAGAEDGKLYAFDTKTGDVAWAFPTGGPLASPAISDGTYIYLPARDGYMHIISTEGRKVGRCDIGYAVKCEPTRMDSFIYVLGSNRVKAFDLRERKEWWDRAFADEFPQHIVSGEGTIVVVTDKPWIYAFPMDHR